MISVLPRADDGDIVHSFVSPYKELNIGLWSLFAGATIALGLRVWCKTLRRHGLWYDDYILIFSWMILLSTNILIIHQFATGYILENSAQNWDDRMHILINISSCGTLLGQALTKTAFGVTLLRLSNTWQKCVLWFCIVTMNLWMISKVFLQWAKVCNNPGYQNWYRFNFCIGADFRDDFKEGGNIYNIIMDFLFASFPWLITRKLEMRKVEKIGLCITMSLGMIVAIVSAIRVGWKNDGNNRDDYYIWRNGISQIWYSSEVTGTIIVQCIPILRPLLREIKTTLSSRRLGSSSEGRRTTLSSVFTGKRGSLGVNNDLGKKVVEKIALGDIKEEPVEKAHGSSRSPSRGIYTPKGQVLSDEWPLTGSESSEIFGMHSPKSVESEHRGGWPLSGSEDSEIFGYHTTRSIDIERDGASHSFTNLEDPEEAGHHGLSPPPRRLTYEEPGKL